MPPLVHTALGASILLSALGAVIVCLLTVLYGFTPPGDESPDRVARRSLLTRIGHAVAAVCFAGTAILLVVVLGQSTRSSSAPADDARVPALDAKLDTQIQRLQGVEQRMKDSEQTLERLEMEVSEVATRRLASDAPPAPVKPPAPAPAGPPAPKPAERSAPAVGPPPPVAPPTERAVAPKPLDEPAASPGPPPAPLDPLPAATPPPAAPSSSPVPAAASAQRSRESAPTATDVLSKLRDDWRAIQRGWERAGDDFRRAIAPLRGE